MKNISLASQTTAEKAYIELIEGYVSLSKSFVKDRDLSAVIAATAANDAPNENLVNGKRVQAGDYILADINDKEIREGEMYLVQLGPLLELVKVLPIEQGYQFHRTRDSFIHADDSPEQFIVGRAFEIIKKNRKEK